jgi:hypothetical protein
VPNLPAFDEIRKRIQALADATSDADVRIKLGAPGGKLIDPDDNEVEDTGQSWETNTDTDLVLRGLADYIQTVVIAKVNELIASYEAIRASHTHVENVAPAYTQNATTNAPTTTAASVQQIS